ncbi:hypothetical protein DL768_010384 [Monosporascus sp. mg162]|nr:hypothetical protein DL768_010384 [Monosporascus sp. mg162]
MNGTAGEQWEFDGYSEDGSQFFIFGFYRDPNYNFLGTGNLRLSADFLLSDGSRYSIVEYAEESIIESCLGQGTSGTWRGDGWAYTFEVSADMTRAKVVVDNPEAKGTIILSSITPPRYADANTWPSNNASLLTVPHFYLTEPIPVADMMIDMVIEGKTVSWTGIGGHTRLWGAFNWFTCLASMTIIRLRTGPFALSYWDFGSNLQKGLVVPSAFLVENGDKVFGSRLMETSEAEDYLTVRKLYGGDGNTTHTLADKATGLEIEMTSPSRQLQWRFTAKHKNVGFEYYLGEGTGGTGYVGVVTGGLAGSEQWTGPVFTEILKFPQKSLMLAKNYVK